MLADVLVQILFRRHYSPRVFTTSIRSGGSVNISYSRVLLYAFQVWGRYITPRWKATKPP